MVSNQEDVTNFKDVGVEIWTSFNSLHTRNNMDTLSWALEKGLNMDMAPQDSVVDFGCGCVSVFNSEWDLLSITNIFRTGETVEKMAGLGSFGRAQIIGLDTNLSFIKYAIKQVR